MKIGIDLDEVIADTLPTIIEFHNKAYGTSLEKKDFFSYEFYEVWGGTYDEDIEKIYKYYKSEYFTNIRPFSGAEKVLNILKINNELFLVTSRQKDIEKETRDWIERYFPNTFASIYITNAYAQHGLMIKKSQICNQLNLDIFIDDNLEYCKDCIAPNRRILLFDQPWNQTTKLPKGIERVRSWKEIMRNITKQN